MRISTVRAGRELIWGSFPPSPRFRSSSIPGLQNDSGLPLSFSSHFADEQKHSCEVLTFVNVMTG